MKIIFSLLAISIASLANAQYFYKDIYSNKELTENLETYRKNSIRKIDIKSIEPDGSESKGFFCNKKISKDYRKTELFTRADFSSASLMTTTFDAEGRILSNVDSSQLSVSRSFYSYDPQGKLQSVKLHSESSDDDFKTELREDHLYEYDSVGHLASMKQVRYGNDTTLFLFATDEKGNVLTEYDTRRDSYYYYYYDAENRLTDVVVSNSLQPKPTPHYLFQYKRDKLVQMTTIEEGLVDYVIWKYTYDGDLRISEKCLANGKKLLGSVNYEYK